MMTWAQIASNVTAPRPPTTVYPGACARWVCLPWLKTLLHFWALKHGETLRCLRDLLRLQRLRQPAGLSVIVILLKHNN
jgi:hypothetical protein